MITFNNIFDFAAEFAAEADRTSEGQVLSKS
jgi:hypothetical protein